MTKIEIEFDSFDLLFFSSVFLSFEINVRMFDETREEIYIALVFILQHDSLF